MRATNCWETTIAESAASLLPAILHDAGTVLSKSLPHLASYAALRLKITSLHAA